MSYDGIRESRSLGAGANSPELGAERELTEISARVAKAVRDAVSGHQTPTPQRTSSGSTTPQSDQTPTLRVTRSASGTPVELRVQSPDEGGGMPVHFDDGTVRTVSAADAARATGRHPLIMRLTTKGILFSDLQRDSERHDRRMKAERLHKQLRESNPSIQLIDVERVVEFIEERKKYPLAGGQYLPSNWYFHRKDHPELFCSIYYDRDTNDFYLLLTSSRQGDRKSAGQSKVMCSGISYSGEKMIARVASQAGGDWLLNSAGAAAELKSYSLFDHPNVAKVICASELTRRKKVGQNGIFWIMDRYQMLSEVMERRIPHPFQLIRTAARGLAHIHQRGYVHGDIKPENLGVEGGEELLILDLGTVSRDRPENYSTFEFTRAYIPPCAPSDPFYGRHPKNDVWALGAILFQMLTREPWIKGSDVQRGRGRIKSFLESREPLFEPMVDSFLRRALALSREERLTSEQFLDGLDEIIRAQGS